MSGLKDGSGWLPVEAHDALEAERDRASAEATEALLALPPRARVLALLGRACPAPADPPPVALRPGDLARVLDSFEGSTPTDAEAFAARFAALL
jgi:hypothetical protein